MTVIAWDSKTLVSDSMATDRGGFFRGNVKKLYNLKSGAILGTAGDSDARAVIALLDPIKDGSDLPSKSELETTKTGGVYLLILPDKSVWTIDISFDDESKAYKASVDEEKGKFVAVGHGQDFATAAMALGKTAEEAVRLACKYAVTCRLPLQTMTLSDKPKEKIKRVRKPKDVSIEG